MKNASFLDHQAPHGDSSSAIHPGCLAPPFYHSQVQANKFTLDIINRSTNVQNKDVEMH